MTATPERPSHILHGSCVAMAGRGVLIVGPSGAGKSALALQLMALGAQLVADDRTVLTADGDQLIASAPANLRGLIEARGMGILNAPYVQAAPLHLVADLSQTETERLPRLRRFTLLGLSCDLVQLSHGGHFPAALMCYLLHGRFA